MRACRAVDPPDALRATDVAGGARHPGSQPFRIRHRVIAHAPRGADAHRRRTCPRTRSASHPAQAVGQPTDMRRARSQASRPLYSNRRVQCSGGRRATRSAQAHAAWTTARSQAPHLAAWLEAMRARLRQNEARSSAGSRRDPLACGQDPALQRGQPPSERFAWGGHLGNMMARIGRSTMPICSDCDSPIHTPDGSFGSWPPLLVLRLRRCPQKRARTPGGAPKPMAAVGLTCGSPRGRERCAVPPQATSGSVVSDGGPADLFFGIVEPQIVGPHSGLDALPAARRLHQG